MEIDYENYFRNQHKYTFTRKDLVKHEKWFYSQYRFLSSLIDIQPGDKILEIGSGSGGFYMMLPDEIEYTGLELDAEAVDFSRRYFNTDSFKKQEIEGITETSIYDFVFAFEVLEHLRNPLDSIRIINDALKPGGTFCGTSPYPYYRYIYGDKTHLFVLHPRNWERLFLYNGFENVELYAMSFIPFLWRINKHLNPVLRVYLPIKYLVSTCLIIAKKKFVQ